MNTRSLFILIYICLYCLPSAAQNKDAPLCPGTIWTNRVQRTVYLDSTIKHAPSDTSLAEILTNLVLDKKLTACSTFDSRFNTKLTKDQVLEKISTHADNANQQEDPVTGSTNTRVVRHEFNYNTIRAYRLIEEWQYNVDEGKIDIRIVGIAPVQDVYGEDGTFRGPVNMYWLKYADVEGLIFQYNKTHPKSNLYKQVWKSYCNGQALPYTNGNVQSGLASRTAVMLDTTDYWTGRKIRSDSDTLLSERLLNQARLKKTITVYDTGANWISKPLSIQRFAAITFVVPDTTYDCDWGRIHLMNNEFRYEFLSHYALLQQVTYDSHAGHISFHLQGVRIQKDEYDDMGYFVKRTPLATFKYSDIKPIINRYTMQHPFCNLPLELWRGYFTERE